jgi:hypothetical protein
VSVRYPEVATVRPSLAQDLGAAQATQLSRVLAEQVLRQTLPVDDDYKGYVFYTPPERSSIVERWLSWARGRAGFEWNEGRDAAERIVKAFHFASDQGADRIIQIGTHCLDLKRSLLQKVFDALDDNDAIVGPSNSGGCYLLAMKVFPDGLLESVPWDTPYACTALCESLSDLGLEFEVLPDAIVIDTAQDLDLVPPAQWAALPPKTREELRVMGLNHLIDEQTGYPF